MVFTMLLSIVAAALAGLVIKYVLERQKSFNEITWAEYAIGMTVFSLIITPLIGWGLWTLAKNEKLTYHQYVNGWELAALKTTHTCTRDGPCAHDYSCDPYPVLVPYSCNCGKNGCSTCLRSETRYHACPYADVETTYTVQTTLGEYTISPHRFPDNPQQHRWRKSESILESLIQSVGVGIPPFWQEALNRVQANMPGPMTQLVDYDNYIFASEHTILKQYSGEVARYRQAGILPAISRSVHDFYWSDKVSFVGFQPQDTDRLWQRSLEYLNAAFGPEREGDIRLVVVKNKLADENPELYALTLKAYWQDTAVFEKFALPKNTIVIIVGTADEKTVSWARAFTGMPLGNEAMVVELQEKLKGLPLSAEAILGTVRGKFTSMTSVGAVHGTGAVEKIACGLDNRKSGFRRISMTGKNPDDIGSGFLYLANEINIGTDVKAGAFALTFLISLGGWFFFAQADIRIRWRKNRY